MAPLENDGMPASVRRLFRLPSIVCREFVASLNETQAEIDSYNHRFSDRLGFPQSR